jgi:hypothetical protein
MKANELRIGNWVYDNSKGFADRTIGERQVSHELIYSMACGNDKEISGIPLTEEWLLKFGFTRGFRDEFEIKNKDSYFQSLRKSNDGYVHCWSGNFDDIESSEIQHVHQLQNLYFALTGEELIVKY